MTEEAFESGEKKVNTYDYYSEKLKQNRVNTGITLREYYAGLAMQGMLADPNTTYNESVYDTVKFAVEAADALLEELIKQDGDEN